MTNKTTEALKYDILVLKIAARFLHKAVSAKERCDYWIVKELIAKKEMQLAETVKQEPVAWQPMETLKPTVEELDILIGDGSVLCNVLTQADGDLWWNGYGTGEKFIDPEYADVTHWRKHSDATPPSVAEWEKLRDPVALHQNLLRGLPAQLTPDMLKHLLGNEFDKAVEAAIEETKEKCIAIAIEHAESTLEEEVAAIRGLK